MIEIDRCTTTTTAASALPRPLRQPPDQVRFDSGIMDHIRAVIRDMATPSWLPSVPRNFGLPAAGTLKADEWRTLATVYLPVALISTWGEGSIHSSQSVALSLRQALDHTMALVSAITLACMRTMTEARSNAYLTHMKFWLHNLTVLHPDTKPRVNCHMALHIFDFLRLFGPVRSWWCFPFERLIGQLQRLPHNHKFGMSILLQLKINLTLL
ncbi:hypothetical protein GALMADRAFT_78901 [Galerina marginata CBS 339.88]|uniref:DUF4218 domain-containing protein n=1 Tax=Galerina marginata (strain CBS 339.88) TaxID=685588 RepID=A0A067SN41_GALM3|nr:hypothetical protein GALMADRAFT_78901 [Galerina marginata CBS 339.88]